MCKRLHRGGHPPVRVALPQHRVYSTPEHLRIRRGRFLLLLCLGVGRKIRDLISFRLQFCNGFFQLRDGRADVRQLDDVRLHFVCELPQEGKGIRLALGGSEVIGELSNDAGGEGDVGGLHFDLVRGCEAADDGEEGVRGELRGLVADGVVDLKRGGEV